MSERLFTFEGVRNFRDFGGYETRDGARIRTGHLLRSGHFAEATDGDVAALDRLGCSFVVDMRRPEERQRQPNRWPGEGVRVHISDRAERFAAPEVRFFKIGEIDAAAADRFMCAEYAAIAYEPRLTDLFAAYLNGLLEAEGPAVAHCASGKDRTGILSAVLLLALDAPREAVFADYEATNRAVDVEARIPRVKGAMEKYSGRSVPIEAVRPFVAVKADYLASALQAIEEKNGSVAGYLRDAVGFDEARQVRLRARLLA
jgi:protein-tyrosine phosphatase